MTDLSPETDKQLLSTERVYTYKSRELTGAKIVQRLCPPSERQRERHRHLSIVLVRGIGLAHRRGRYGAGPPRASASTRALVVDVVLTDQHLLRLGELDERAMVVLALRVDGGLCEHRLGAEVLDQPVGRLEGG